jgi:predicted RNase H-like HicB family nuclease
MKFRVLVGRQKDGSYTAECSSIHDCSSEGSTKEELFRNMEETISHSISKKRANIEPSYGEDLLKKRRP